jgi:hypothetical protein
MPIRLGHRDNRHQDAQLSCLEEFSQSYWPFQRLETGFRHLIRIHLVNVGPLAGKLVGGPVTYSLL